jgi:hypothetical protein
MKVTSLAGLSDTSRNDAVHVAQQALGELALQRDEREVVDVGPGDAGALLQRMPRRNTSTKGISNSGCDSISCVLASRSGPMPKSTSPLNTRAGHVLDRAVGQPHLHIRIAAR